MESGEDKEENNPGKNQEDAPEADNPQIQSPKEPTPDPPPKSPTPQKTPTRSITPPPKAGSVSKTAVDKSPSKSITSTAKVSETIDESPEPVPAEKVSFKETRSSMTPGGNDGGATFPGYFGEYANGGLFKKRSPFIHDPPQPEERRPRFTNPRTPREYIINLREDLADFQESHGLPRTRDYSFLSLGLALVQETARSIYSVLLMFAELFPILAVVSLILRFALDKLIEILETPEPVPKLKKSLIFVVEMIVIVIPLWILIGSIVIPLISLILSMFARMLRLKKGRR